MSALRATQHGQNKETPAMKIKYILPLFFSACLTLILNNHALAQPAQQTVGIAYPYNIVWDLVDTKHDDTETTVTFAPPRNSQFHSGTRVVQKIIPYANLPYTDHPNINSHSYQQQLVNTIHSQCNKVITKNIAQTAKSNYFMVAGMSCSGSYPKFATYVKVFDGIDALYLIRYDILDINSMTDNEGNLMIEMIRSSKLVNNPQYHS
jgi:hypothetical protein